MIANLVGTMTVQLYVVAVIGVGGNRFVLGCSSRSNGLATIIISVVQAVWLTILSDEKGSSGTLDITCQTHAQCIMIRRCVSCKILSQQTFLSLRLDKINGVNQ